MRLVGLLFVLLVVLLEISCKVSEGKSVHNFFFVFILEDHVSHFFGTSSFVDLL